MLIREVIQTIKSIHNDKDPLGNAIIFEETTRDQVLYGNIDQECTGIVSTIYASVDVIRKAHELGANFIVSHEACWWNHGDHQDWLAAMNNKAYFEKKALLDEYGITVWRDHDYIHCGTKVKGQYVDGIFYGLMQQLDWEKYYQPESRYGLYVIPETSVYDLVQYLCEKMNLNGIQIMGQTDKPVSRVLIAPGHILGGPDNSIIKRISDDDVDVLIACEITDFTVAMYMRDAAMLGDNKTILHIGHFNVEEPGMQWFAKYLQEIFEDDFKVIYVQAGDTYGYIPREK